jgi:NADP-dependent 3-hydroxy acid dehydrogenase YdfG
LDITDRKSIQHFVSEIKQEYGVDALISNVGLSLSRPTSGVRTYEDEEKVMDVNFGRTLQDWGYFIPIMKGEGHIVNLSSLESNLKPY